MARTGQEQPGASSGSAAALAAGSGKTKQASTRLDLPERLPSIDELGACLLAAGPASILEWPLVRLIASIEDRDTRELFEHVASDHRGFNLRAILRFRELDPWVARTCTVHEAELIRRQLQAWLELESSGFQRTRSWQEPIAEPELALLAKRLLAVIELCRGADAPAPVFSQQRGLAVDTAQALVHAELCSDQRQASQGRFGVFRCELSLQGFEHSPLSVRCACAEGPSPFHCCHARAIAGHLLDVLHGRDTSLRRALAGVCSTPSWVRFFSVLGPSEIAGGALTEGAEQRLCYRLAVRKDASVSVELLLQRRKSGGGYTRGARLAPDEVPASLELEPHDQLAVGLMRSSAPGRSASVALLRVLMGHPCVVAADDQLAVEVEETQITLAFDEVPEAGALRACARLGDLSLEQVSELPQGDHLAHLSADGRKLRFAPLPSALARWVWTLGRAPTLLPRESHAQLRKRLRELQPHVQLQLPAALLGEPDTRSKRLLLRLENNLSEGLRLSLHSRPVPGGPVYAPGEGPSEVLGEEGGKASYALRDLAWERATLAELQDVLLLDSARELGPLRYSLDSREAALAVIERVARARELVDIEWLEGHRPLRLLEPVKRTDLKLRVGHAERWYEASGYAQVDASQQVSL
ncbi:MAG TPA: hypothetical protein VMF89_01210, partial [Polyangiales bacterium]|nr:hypothetical protein [Polyangiales bacterium]